MLRRRSRLSSLLAGASALALCACIPADESLPTGSVEFLLATKDADTFIDEGAMADSAGRGGGDNRSWDIRIDRVRFSFKTMTIGSVTVADQCAYRGRGARSNVVFEPERGNTQTFNGILPGDCPDVGIVFGPPDALTKLGEGMTVADVAAFLAPPASHAIIEATATPGERSLASNVPNRPYRLFLRFDTTRTTSTFGGCRDEQRGIHITPAERLQETVAFSPKPLFRNAISPTAQLRFAPFALADDQGDADGIVTMEELDLLPLTLLTQFGAFYRLPDGISGGTFGDFVRAQLRFTFSFGQRGLCTGNPAGVGTQ